jgi:hypothetical protein
MTRTIGNTSKTFHRLNLTDATQASGCSLTVDASTGYGIDRRRSGSVEEPAERAPQARRKPQTAWDMGPQ